MKRVTGSCPLGSKCEDVETRNGEKVLAVCPWYVEIQGQDKQGNSHDKHDCAISWMPILQIEVAGTNREQTGAIESFRNETVKGQAKFNQLTKNNMR